MSAMFSSFSFVRRLGALRRPAGLHRAIQYAFAVFFLYVGLRFYAYVQWIMGLSPDYVPKPASAEAFLPISALLAAKRLILTGEYDFVLSFEFEEQTLAASLSYLEMLAADY